MNSLRTGFHGFGDYTTNTLGISNSPPLTLPTPQEWPRAMGFVKVRVPSLNQRFGLGSLNKLHKCYVYVVLGEKLLEKHTT